MKMDRQSKELVASSHDGHLKVFVRSGLQELTKNDLEIIAGGRRAMWVPDG